MGSFLSNSFSCLIQPFRGIRIPDYIVFEDAFEPGTGSGITSNLHIQMIAVPIQVVADERGARILYGSARRDDNLYLIRLSRFLHCIGNSLIHGELIAVVVFKSTMPGSRCIRPGLVQHQLCFLWKACFYIFYELGKRSFIRLIHSRKRTCLLQADVIPVFICKHRFQRHLTLFPFFSICTDFPVGIGRSIVTGIFHMTFQGTAANKHIADYG